MTHDQDLIARLDRIAAALDRLAPPAAKAPDFDAADAFVWHADPDGFQPVTAVNRVPLGLLKGISRVADQLIDNTARFARGLPANNALLWGARGMGKSSLVKAAHYYVGASDKSLSGASDSPPGSRPEAPKGVERTGSRLEAPKGVERAGSRPEALTTGAAGRRAERVSAAPMPRLKLVEIHREDIASLPRCLGHIRPAAHRFIVFCDDLSFDRDDTSYKSLKAVLEGGIEGRPDNVIFYATSNRRHLMPRDMMENERSTAINPSEAVEEKVSLSDRFGLWLGFHNGTQDDYLEMIRGYAEFHGLKIGAKELEREALEWSATRGGRSGRVAWQFIQDLAGRLGATLRTE